MSAMVGEVILQSKLIKLKKKVKHNIGINLENSFCYSRPTQKKTDNIRNISVP